MSTTETLREIIKGLKIHYDQQKKWHEETLAAVRGDDLSLNLYQSKAVLEFAVYKDQLYPVLALAEEAGEISALFAKSLRKQGDCSEVDREMLKDELGDVLWNIAAIAWDNEIDLLDIAMHNISKLTTRRENDQIVERSRKGEIVER